MISTEWLTGTIGLATYFGQKPIKMTQSQVTQALKAETYITQRAKSWAAAKRPGQLPKDMLGIADYDMVITALGTPELAHPDISRLPSNWQLDFVTAFMDIGYYLQSQQPAVKMSGGFIAREIEPPSSDKSRFMWACNAINDIHNIYDLFDAGALTVIEADAFKQLFPETALFTATEYLKAAIEYIYNNEKPTMASWQLQGLSALMGVPMADFQDVAGWQMGYDRPKGPGRPPLSKPLNIAKAQLTDSQQLDSPA